MPRARNIKPSFFTNDRLAEIAPLGRLLFAGLWTVADREGRLEDRPKRLKAELLPYDNCDVEKLLTELHSGGFVLRYTVKEVRYIQVLAFAKHQNPHVKEPPSAIPAPDKNSASPVQLREIPERAGLIPDSLNLIPDSIKPESRAAPAPDSVRPDVWQGWLNYRGKQKRQTIELQAQRLDDWARAGHDPNGIIETSIANSWSGLFPPKNVSPARPVSLAEERKRKMDEICGVTSERVVNGVAERVGTEIIQQVPRLLREQGRDGMG